MKTIALVVPPIFQKNEIFNADNALLNRDELLHAIRALKNAFRAQDFDLSTCDINSPEQSDYVLYFDIPKQHIPPGQRHKSYVVLFESEVIVPRNFKRRRHQDFAKIFTWHEDFVDHQKYFKINFSHKIPNQIACKSLARDKLCCLIAGGKLNVHKLELYSERLQAIKWFEQNHPDDFDFYGIGWDRVTFTGSRLLSLLNRINWVGKLLAPNLASYKGPVANKSQTMSKYRFAICYENARDIPGYITEKIFDCFFAGCVPIYWGAPDITDHIPANCFVDRRKFKSMPDLYTYLRNMSDKTYGDYLNAIESFLNSKQANPFRSETFASTIANEILRE